MICFKLFIKLFSDFNILFALLGVMYTYAIDNTFQKEFIRLGIIVIVFILNEKILRYQLKVGLIKHNLYGYFTVIFTYLLFFFTVILAWIDIIMRYFNMK